MRSGETTLGPTVRGTVSVEEGIFLFKTEPRNFLLGLLHHLRSVMAVVGFVWSAIVVVALGEYKDVITATEGIFEDGRRTEVDIGIVAWGLIGGRTIEVPYAELTNIGDFLAHGLNSTVFESGIPAKKIRRLY